MEFETIDKGAEKSALLGVNLLRWSLKPASTINALSRAAGVNLLRWSLKPSVALSVLSSLGGVNLLRWSLKLLDNRR